MTRIFDDPKHPQYGPIRRLWVVLAQLDLLESAETWGETLNLTWDGAVAEIVPQIGESAAQRWFLRHIL